MTQLTENLTVWELWYFKAVNQLSWRAFSSSYSTYNCYSPDRRVKVDLTRHPKFPLAFGERSFPTLSWQSVFFIGGRNLRNRRKLLTCCKSLTNGRMTKFWQNVMVNAQKCTDNRTAVTKTENGRCVMTTTHMTIGQA
jgi:hypothetical protein